MQLGMIGVGRRGKNMARRLIRGGHQVAVYSADLTYGRLRFCQACSLIRGLTDVCLICESSENSRNRLRVHAERPGRTRVVRCGMTR